MRKPHSHPQARRFKIANRYTSCISGVPKSVVTSYCRVVCTVVGMGNSGSPAYRDRRRERERQRRQHVQRAPTKEARSDAPAPKWTAANDAPPRRPVAGAVGRSRREAGDRSPSGVRPPAGTAPGRKPGPRARACPRWPSWSDASRFGSRWRRPAVTGLGCSTNAPPAARRSCLRPRPPRPRPSPGARAAGLPEARTHNRSP